MTIDILIEIEDNNATFKVCLPLEFSEINENLYFELTDKIFYKQKSLVINENRLNEAISLIEELIYDNFIKQNELAHKLNYKFSIISGKSIEDDLSFIKCNKNFDLIYRTNKYDKFLNNFTANDFPNLKILFQYSDIPIPYEEFYGMYNYLMEIVDFIKYYDLSPFEQVILAYDIVKSRIYKEEDETESYRMSRDLNEIIKGNKIVCTGFSNLLDFILKQLNFKTRIVLLNYLNSETGHQKNLIYLDDEKYGINNAFLLDPTWDSKNNDDYLENYKHFLRPIYYRFNKTEEIKTIPQSLNLLRKNEEEIINVFEKNIFIEKMPIIVSLNSLLKFCGLEKINKSMNLNKEDIIQILHTLRKKYFYRIPNEKFANALYKVRRVEYINNIYKKGLRKKKYIQYHQ